MKKFILFIGTALFVVFISSCTPDEIEQNNPTQKMDIEKRANNGGDQGLGIEVPRR